MDVVLVGLETRGNWRSSRSEETYTPLEEPEAATDRMTEVALEAGTSL